VSATLALAILALAAAVVVAFLVLNANRRRRRLEDVPLAMRPAYSDDELERQGGILERYMQWGMVLTVGLAIFFPVYWFNEERRLDSETGDFFEAAIARGEESYQENCAECHAPNLAGGSAPSPYEGDAAWPAPALNNIATRYADSRNVTDVRDFIIETLQRGRPGTPMPTWGAAYGGPMTDQNIEDVATYILANQVTETTEADAAANLSGEELYQGNCAKCHGVDLASGNNRPGPSLIGVTERHSREDIIGILTNGIYIPTGAVMPGFGEVLYQYEGARYNESALNKVVDYLESCQPGQIPDEALSYQTPGLAEAGTRPSPGCGGDAEGAAALPTGETPTTEESPSEASETPSET
jgi:mono/diheme cytochrome c family protein